MLKEAYILQKTAIILLGLIMCSNAYTQMVIPLYEGDIPNSNSTADIEKRTARPNGYDWVTDVSKPTLTYYSAANATSPKSPAVLICPGGGYAGLSIVLEGDSVAREFSLHGVAAFVLKYRLPNDKLMKDKAVGPLQDAQQALLLIRRNAANWNINADQVGIIGFSAGGHLASTVGTHFSKPVVHTNGISVRPDFMMLIYPVISLRDSLTHMGSRKALLGNNPSEALVDLYSNEMQVAANTPPAFIVHAGDDKTVKVKNSLVFYESLNSKKVKAQLLIYPSGGHGFGLNNPATSDKWMEHCLLWLNESILKNTVPR